MNAPTAPIALRPARPDDEPFLFRVYASTRDDELKVTGWDEAQKAAFLRMQYEAQARHYREHFPGSGYEVVLVGDVPVGRFYLRREADSLHIVDIALLPEHRNRGIGGVLMKRVLTEGAATGLPVRIHVERFNPALRFYERLGFAPIADHGVYLELEWKPPAV